MADKWVRLKSNGNILYPRTQSTLLRWGGPNIAGSALPLDTALCDELSANRFAEMPTANFVFEQSSDAGSSWTTYDADGYSLVTESTSTVQNTNIVGDQSVSNWHRFTIDVRPGSSNNFYGEIRKFLFYVNTVGATGCRVKIEGSTFTTPDTFVQIADAPISGWSGWNVINVSITAGLGAESFYKKLRFTFSQKGVDSSYSSCLYVYKMRVYCANCWSAPGRFALQNRTYYLLNGEQRQQYSIRFEAGKKLYGIATNADLANNSLRLGDQLPAYYLNYNNLSNKPTHSFAHATGKFTGISGTVYYSIFADKDNYNDITKIHGVLKVTYATTSDTYKYRMINLSNFRNALGTSSYGHLTHANFLHGMWWGNRNDGKTLDMYGYGTCMKKSDTNDYIGLGRYYPASFSYGNWAQDTFLDQMKDGCIFIEMYFKNL